MAYWGCSTFPSNFIGGTIRIRKAFSVSGLSSVSSFKNKKSKSFSAADLSTSSLKTKDYKTRVYSVNNRIGVFSTQIFARKSYSTSMVEHLSKATQNQQIKTYSVGNIVPYNKAYTQLKRSSSSVCIPVAYVSGAYYWQCFEEIEEDDNTSIIEEDCN